MEERKVAGSPVKREGLVWRDAQEEVFSLFGLYDPRHGAYRRLPAEVAAATGGNAAVLYTNTSGGRVCFETDSPYVAIRMETEAMTVGANMSPEAASGLDIYIEKDGRFTYYKPFFPPTDLEGAYGRGDGYVLFPGGAVRGNRTSGYESVVDLPGGCQRVLIHFPLYNNVDALHIGLREGAALRPYSPYRDRAPIVFYGSSITHGGCASHPGNIYPAILSRILHTDYLNLGFSGGAHGELPMAAYIAGLSMSVFVMDYDHNDNAEGLRAHHWPFYRYIRERRPELPIVFATAPNYDTDPCAYEERRQVILANYERAKANGEPVWFVDGKTMFGTAFRDCATADMLHPNDYGFVKMAEAFYEALRQIPGVVE